MKIKFKKVKTEHTIMDEFHKILLEIEKNPEIIRIIPGRISRQQKGSSDLRFRVSYKTESGIKCIMSKGASAQELFVVCNDKDTDSLIEFLKNVIK
ncbi:DUF2103 domain-containing protein [Candidatus Gracilibacteria bacterium]|nr:DUF2103 domain-containing protein [Candidatus Gracilibacteria bacterium]